MTKYIFILLSTLCFTQTVFAQISSNFEAELLLLEKNEISLEKKQLDAVEAISKSEANLDMMEDSVSEGQASAERTFSEEDFLPVPTQKVMPIKKIRRIRSR
jgi:hypothetical protein